MEGDGDVVDGVDGAAGGQGGQVEFVRDEGDLTAATQPLDHFTEIREL